MADAFKVHSSSKTVAVTTALYVRRKIQSNHFAQLTSILIAIATFIFKTHVDSKRDIVKVCTTPILTRIEISFSRSTDDPIVIEDGTLIIEAPSRIDGCKAVGGQAHEDNTEEPMPCLLEEAQLVNVDLVNVESGCGYRFTKDPSTPPVEEPEIPADCPQSGNIATHPCAEPAEEQIVSQDLVGEDDADTIVVDCAMSEREGSPDDSEDEDYVEEKALPMAKRRRLDYASCESQLPMSPANTLDEEGKGSSSGVPSGTDRIPVCGSLMLKEVDGNFLYSLTFSQCPLPHCLEQRHNDAGQTSKSTSSKVATSSFVQSRRQGVRRRYKFTKEDDDNIIQMREDGKSWDEIRDEIPGSTKGSIQVHYSTKLKDRKLAQ